MTSPQAPSFKGLRTICRENIEFVRSDAVGRLDQIIKVAAEWVERLAVDRANFEEFLAKTRALVCGTCVGIGRTQLGVAKNRYDWVVVDEAARATPTELAVAIQSGARILLVGDHRQLPPLYKQEVISHVSQVLGYHDRGALTRSDFQRAFLSSYGSEVGVMLQTQYRMAPAIGNLVSECFYPTPLISGRGDAPDYFSLAPEHIAATVTWIDTSRAGKAAQDRKHKTHSYDNPFEANEIISLLRAIYGADEFMKALVADMGDDEKPIGVICMYADQKRLIQERFSQQDWASQFRRFVKIDTVDSYQGKQNRIIIISPTRNNLAYQQGHVESLERVNVSLSRAMERLVIVGATRMWHHRNRESPFGSSLRVHFAIGRYPPLQNSGRLKQKAGDEMTPTDRHLDRLPFSEITFAIPAQKFGVTCAVSTEETLPVVTEFAIRLVYIASRLTPAQLQQFFGFSDNETAAVIKTLLDERLVRWDEEQLGLTTYALEKFIASSDKIPRCFKIRDWSSEVYFDLISFSPIRRSGSGRSKAYVEIRPTDTDKESNTVHWAERALIQHFREICRLQKAEIYKISEVDPGERLNLALNCTFRVSLDGQADVSRSFSDLALEQNKELAESISDALGSGTLKSNDGFWELLRVFQTDFKTHFSERSRFDVSSTWTTFMCLGRTPGEPAQAPCSVNYGFQE